MKVIVVYGTRPEAIKMAPVIRALKEDPAFDALVYNTGQHRDLVRPIEAFFGIEPDADLAVMTHGQTPLQVISRCLTALEPLIIQERPEWILAQGDTSTVLAAALAAFHHKVRFGHVEAGLRTGDLLSPFPEELNRVLAGKMTSLHFAPTALAARNLRQEGYPEQSVVVTGNTVIDALYSVRSRFSEYADPELFGRLARPKLALVTLHRRESFGAPMESLMSGLRQIASTYRDEFDFVFPVHPNPQVRDLAHRTLSDTPNVHLVAPLAYFDLVKFLDRAYLVVTDSGGIQEEAPGFGKPVLVCRENTERPEGVESGVVRLVGSDGKNLVRHFDELASNPDAYARMARAVNPYGDGKAAERIASALKTY